MKYHLGEACENAFILFDCLDNQMVNEEFLKQARNSLEKENKDDALILTDKKVTKEGFFVRMLVLGLDGTLGEFCGNGARVVAAYLFTLHPNEKNIFIVTPFGAHPLKRHEASTYSIQLPLPSFAINPKFVQGPLPAGIYYVEVIEPHLVIEAKMSDEMLLTLGQTLNQKRDLFPHGINVNAWHVIKEGTLFVKTYERGVQRLTRSCGTGSIACAAFYNRPYTKVLTPGGILMITLHNERIELKGAASFLIEEK